MKIKTAQPPKKLICSQIEKFRGIKVHLCALCQIAASTLVVFFFLILSRIEAEKHFEAILFLFYFFGAAIFNLIFCVQ